MEDQNEDESPKKSTLWQVGMAAHREDSTWLTADKMLPQLLSSVKRRAKDFFVLCNFASFRIHPNLSSAP